MEKKTRKHRVDRSQNKYSVQDFINLPREEQMKLANKYLMQPVAMFDEDGTFKFSYTQFVKVCKSIGIEKGVVDKAYKETIEEKIILKIEHGKRVDTVKKQYTFSRETMDMFESLFEGATKNIGNYEKSKILDLILSDALKEMLRAKEEGRLSIGYVYYSEDLI